MLDMGQCNDAYSAVQVAVALSGALNVPVNNLPLSFVISFFEQKSVAVLLTLLSLNIQNITLGPKLPAWLTENNLKAIVDAFGVRPISDDAAGDIKRMVEEQNAAMAQATA